MPTSLKVFLLALAIIDDLGVILIIALFYTAELNTMALAIAGGATLLLFWMNRRGVDRLSLYLSLRDDPDERVQGALEDMLEGVKW